MSFELLEPIRFPGDDYLIRLNITQVAYLVELFRAIRENNPALFDDPNVEAVNLQLLYQLGLHQCLRGDEQQKASAPSALAMLQSRMRDLRKRVGLEGEPGA